MVAAFLHNHRTQFHGRQIPMTRSICDLSDDHPDRVRTAEAVFRDFGQRLQFHGPITTIRCLEDNALLKSTLSEPGCGRVMVVDGGASVERALFGDMLGSLLLQNDWAGIVINGAVRDVENLRKMPIAVRALGVCPTRPTKFGSGERDIVVAFAGIAFVPGHLLYADENGILTSEQPLV